MTQSAESDRRQPAVPDRREIAKRIFDALCAKFPEKYVALIQPGDSIPAPPTLFRRRMSKWPSAACHNGYGNRTIPDYTHPQSRNDCYFA